MLANIRGSTPNQASVRPPRIAATSSSQMRILTLLPPAAVDRVKLALNSTAVINAVLEQRQFLEIAEAGSWSMLLIDPDLIASSYVSTFLSRVACLLAPLVVYTSLTRSSARTIAILARKSLAAVILRGFDDSLPNLRSILDLTWLEPLGGRMVELLADAFDELPREIRRGTIAAFCASAPITSPTRLAVLSGQSRRSIDRWFTRVGLKPAKCVLTVSQLLRAYNSLEDSSRSLTSVAVVSGFGSARALSHNSLALTGIPVRALRKAFPPLGLIDHLGAELRLPPSV
jgi:hypothetical protein